MRFLSVVMCALTVVAAVPVGEAHAQGKKRKAVVPAVRHGKLSLQVSVPGADVEVDGNPVGTTPLAEPLTLTVGTHALKVSRSGYAEFLDTVKIGTNQTTTLEVELLPFAAVLDVSSMPPGAEVTIDGKLVGQTPLHVEVDPGERVVRVSTDGYHDGERTLAVQAGEGYKIDLELIALPPPPRRSDGGGKPVYKTWWFWTATGVAAIAATALVISATSSGDPLDGADRVIDVRF
jgi:hypothetical protein